MQSVHVMLCFIVLRKARVDNGKVVQVVPFIALVRVQQFVEQQRRLFHVRFVGTSQQTQRIVELAFGGLAFVEGVLVFLENEFWLIVI